MSETTPELDDQNGEPEVPRGDRTVTLRRRDIDALEAKAARAEAAERKLAFAEAGLDLTDKKLGYFVKGYDGELSADAIRSAATDAGFLAASTETVEQASSAQAAAQVTAAAAGSTAPSNEAVRQQEYAAAFEQANKTGDWDTFNQTVAKYGSVVGINLPA